MKLIKQLMLLTFISLANLGFADTSPNKLHSDANNSKENHITNELTCDNQIAYWSLDACVSFSSDGSNLDYSEFTPNTSTPSGFSNVSATNLTHDGGHSCTYGQSGAAICSDIKDGCSWSDNHADAFKFSITVNPSSGYSINLSGLSFYESAPASYIHLSGNSGDNDPPSHYGFRVLKNGQEIYQNTGNSTTENWSLEQFDFSNDPDFIVSSSATFEFELLGYCRQGSNGLSVWDLDEIKIFGCAESTDPCIGQGGDSDGDGTCDNQDCQPNNPAYPATPGSSCNDGNPNTTNDMVTADGCGCAGTPVGPTCSVTTGNCSITIDGLSGSEDAKVFNSNWSIVFHCNQWNGGCNATETITDLENGTYYVQACGETTAYTVSGCATDPCAGQGGDSDGDGTCDNQDCQPNNPAYPATPGSSCNDGNPNTTNDMVTADGCGCAGTPVGPTCSVTTGNCSITIDGLSGSEDAKVFNSNWSIVFHCNQWNGGCNATETITDLENGTYYVQACGETTAYTVSGCATDPCAGQGGDSDGDGTCDNQDCQPNNPAYPATPGSSCNDGNPNTTNDMVTADGCGCAGTPVGPTCSVTTGNCSITIDGLSGSEDAKVFNSNWSIVFHCNQWNGGCNATETITDLENGTYYVQACGETTAYTVSGCATDPCAGQGGDSDGDGTCDNQDCQPNNPAYPATPGSSCNDGNPNTINDMVTADGCGCAGTPVGPTCSVTTGNCSITIDGLSGSEDAKVFNSNWSIVFHCNQWNGGCNATETITDLENGTYYVQACGETTAYTVSGCATDPCAGQGGDSDGDGTCDNQDCQPNNPAYPATPGSSCNDGNPNTTNDMVTADGCGCAGTPVGPTCSVTTGNCSITIDGLSGSEDAKVFNSNWSIVFHCNQWNGGCNATETITDLENGTYYVQACGETTAYTVSGCVTDPCAGQGGDSDGDGVCDNQDNCANTYNPGQGDIDGDGIGDACDNNNNICTPTEIAYWSLDACVSFGNDGSNYDYSELTSSTSTPSGFSNVSATNLTHDGAHSCTYGESGAAVCSSIRDNCSWADNDAGAFRFSVTVSPSNGGPVSLTGLSFYERAPLTYSHLSGNTGDNDPPSHYGFRVLKNGQEVYQNTGNNTTHGWSLEQFDLSTDPDFVVTSQTTFEFELLGYCRQGSNGLAVWDLDEIKVMGCGGDGYAGLETEVSEELYFQAMKDGRDVALYWVTNTDYKNDYFEIERSFDGVDFELLEEVVSKGESIDHINYTEKDANAKIGANYYRIKQIFTNGTFAYSAVKQVNFNIDINEFAIFPNPASDEVFVNLKDFVGNTGYIQLHNSLGQTVKTVELDVISDQPIRISIEDLRAGMHAVSVHIKDKKVMSQMLVVTKL